MSLKNRVMAIPLGAIDATTFSGFYKDFPALPQPCFFIRIINDSSNDVTISYDGGITDHDVVPTVDNGITVLEVPTQTNSQPNSNVALFPKGMVIAVKADEGTGGVYLAGYYQVQGNV